MTGASAGWEQACALSTDKFCHYATPNTIHDSLGASLVLGLTGGNAHEQF